MRGRCLLCLLTVSLLILLLVTMAAVYGLAAKCRLDDCPNFRAIRYYEELGCVRSDGSNDCCPTRFNCSPLLTADKTKCHYQGRTYKPGEETGNEFKLECHSGCECVFGIHKGEASFYCSGDVCPPTYIPPEREDCYEMASLDGCCVTGVRCLNDMKSGQNVTECPYKGRTYREGQEMYGAQFECKRCICQKEFDGTLDGPWCKNNACGYRLFYTISKLGTCAPIFRDDYKCCTTRFHCPSANDTVVRHAESTTENEASANDTVVRHSESITENEGEQCSFGDHRLNVGDELLVGSDGCVKCSCDVPPFIICTKRTDAQC